MYSMLYKNKSCDVLSLFDWSWAFALIRREYRNDLRTFIENVFTPTIRCVQSGVTMPIIWSTQCECVQSSIMTPISIHAPKSTMCSLCQYDPVSSIRSTQCVHYVDTIRRVQSGITTLWYNPYGMYSLPYQVVKSASMFLLSGFCPFASRTKFCFWTLTWLKALCRGTSNQTKAPLSKAPLLDILLWYNMVLTTAQTTSFFENDDQMGIPLVTVVQMQAEGITAVADLERFDK